MLFLVLIVCAVGYLAFGGLLWALQGKMLFVGRSWGRGVALPHVDGVRVEMLDVAGVGEVRIAIAEPSGPVHGAMVFFGGNGEDLQSGMTWAQLWARDYGLRTVYAEHPGYGDSEGEPGVDSFERAAEAAAGRARELAAGLPLCAGGNSLGSFCAMHLASRGLVDRSILRSPPSSIAEIGSSRFPFMPVRWLLRYDFDNLALAPRVQVPVLILHGDVDDIVPIRFARELSTKLGVHSEFIEAKGRDHNDVPMDRGGPFGARIAAFLLRR